MASAGVNDEERRRNDAVSGLLQLGFATFMPDLICEDEYESSSVVTDDVDRYPYHPYPNPAEPLRAHYHESDYDQGDDKPQFEIDGQVAARFRLPEGENETNNQVPVGLPRSRIPSRVRSRVRRMEGNSRTHES